MKKTRLRERLSYKLDLVMRICLAVLLKLLNQLL